MLKITLINQLNTDDHFKMNVQTDATPKFRDIH